MTYPLQALRTFVEVGQRGSIKAAAQALHVTPGAVSQQIRLLEDRLGVVLLERERLGMRLTAAGASFHPKVQNAFLQIDQAVHALEAAKGGKSLTVSTVASFAASWLVPRLGRFKQLHPDIEVRVEATSELVDLRRDRVDVALRHGLGDYPGLDVRPLMAPVLTPVASPAFLESQQAVISEACDCLNYPLLHDSDRADWPLWLKAHGVDDDTRAERGNAFEDDFLLIRAAEAGQGLALVPEAYAQDEIAAGRLVQVLDKPWPARFAYYAVTRPGAAERSEVRAFLDWIQEEAAPLAPAT
ncbi:Gcv operon activator [Achromobacter spanius]|uniref:LysR substrate-binding domain-containing protein n=1 Tax=Achromobacter spanius TaxID=217203 RepID=UPI000C2C8123|nr:LysR substrate-binding domain-containing protein [Achromobacter spanius]AUA57448.1 transcriptional regulator [Achromobacter spanius]CAB3628889.1 Glycine cleavage system transcriptional activator [Achromobacter spanius]SPT37511.1 Gcv operon activator [Achromobacter denitrificans]VEE54834.1 Gcv operon activator [Achromobacter spanius]